MEGVGIVVELFVNKSWENWHPPKLFYPRRRDVSPWVHIAFCVCQAHLKVSVMPCSFCTLLVSILSSVFLLYMGTYSLLHLLLHFCVIEAIGFSNGFFHGLS